MNSFDFFYCYESTGSEEFCDYGESDDSEESSNPGE